MTGRDKLAEYRDKRDFTKTAEPSGEGPDGRDAEGGARFVVQRHDATRLHYDFRLEVDGVLKSWAVPKGPSMQPADKRLAVMTEDHPLGYYDFEGVIPAGEYGGGTVIVWDLGGYDNLTEQDGAPVDLAEAIAAGHFKVRLHGKKLKGAFAMTRTGGRFGKPGDDAWLLVKMKDEEVVAGYDPVKTAPESVLTGRTNEDLGGKKKARTARARRAKPEDRP